MIITYPHIMLSSSVSTASPTTIIFPSTVSSCMLYLTVIMLTNHIHIQSYYSSYSFWSGIRTIRRCYSWYYSWYYSSSSCCFGGSDGFGSCCCGNIYHQILSGKRWSVFSSMPHSLHLLLLDHPMIAKLPRKCYIHYCLEL